MARTRTIGVLLLLALLWMPGCGSYFLKRDPNELEVGAGAPDFNLPAANGGTVTRKDLLEDGKGLVLVFYQSLEGAFCRVQLVKLERRREAFEERNLQVAAISSDPLSRTEDWLEELDETDRIAYPLLADLKHAIIKAYGVYDADHRTALPAVFLIDGYRGRIRWKFIGDSIADRPRIDEILEAAQEHLGVGAAGSERAREKQTGKSVSLGF